eukprot:TRINITY_DN3964_c0_g2_i1.p1 TRINITY_DN3964_c0_g2~~TRINITY_DN3964_c0_g2_i1.p1  ORF type:complete len:445 (-),score=97.06 TRINITY_DN3964_c0_g2_i1:564-1898(-)
MMKLMNPFLLPNPKTLLNPHNPPPNLITFNPTTRFHSPFLHPPFHSPHPPPTPQTHNPRKPPSPCRISCTSTSNFNSTTPSPQSNQRWRTKSASSSSASGAAAEVEMVKNRDGVFTAKQKKVVLLWDLDNKPPRGPPYHAAVALRDVAQRFGRLVDMSAYANRHAFTHLPSWVLNDRRERHRTDILERKGLLLPPEPYICGVCGRKCNTRLDLKKHFRQLHERERQKKLNRMRSLKGKKRQKYKERFISGNRKYQEAERELLTPKVGYGLASELRRAGVFVRTVEDKPQAADWTIKRQMEHSIAQGIDWLFLVSDDSDFSGMLCRARESKMRTVVIGDDGQRALGRYADIWVPWINVENGEVDDEMLRTSARVDEFDGDFEEEGGFFSFSHFDDEEDDESDVDSVVDEIVVTSSGFNRLISAFSEEDLYWDDDGVEREAEEGYY